MTPRAAPTRAWGKRQWVRLVASILGLAMVVASSWYVLEPQWSTEAPRRGIGGWIADRAAPSFSLDLLYMSPNPDMFVKRGVLQRVIVDETPYLRDHGSMESEGGTAAIRKAETGEANACLVWTHYESVLRGWWAPTTVDHSGEVVIRNCCNATGNGEGAPAAYPWDFEAVRREYWRAMYSEGRVELPRSVPALTAGNTWSVRELLVSGYLINTATLLGLGMFLWFTPLTIRDAWRTWRFRGITTCKSCGYDLRGLPDSAPACPECGSPQSARGGAGETSPAS